jgi:hypothetical protein
LWSADWKLLEDLIVGECNELKMVPALGSIKTIGYGCYPRMIPVWIAFNTTNTVDAKDRVVGHRRLSTSDDFATDNDPLEVLERFANLVEWQPGSPVGQRYLRCG